MKKKDVLFERGWNEEEMKKKKEIKTMGNNHFKKKSKNARTETEPDIISNK